MDEKTNNERLSQYVDYLCLLPTNNPLLKNLAGNLSEILLSNTVITDSEKLELLSKTSAQFAGIPAQEHLDTLKRMPDHHLCQGLAKNLPEIFLYNTEITDAKKLSLLSHTYARLSVAPAKKYLEKLTGNSRFTDLIMSDDSQPKSNVQELTKTLTPNLKTTLDDLKAMALLQKDVSRQPLIDKPTEQWKDSDIDTANRLILDPDQKRRIPKGPHTPIRNASINQLKRKLQEEDLNIPAQKLHDQILQNCVFTQEHTQQQEYLRAYNSLKARKAQVRWLEDLQLSEPNILKICYNQNAVEANPILVLGQFCDVLNSQPNQALRNAVWGK